MFYDRTKKWPVNTGDCLIEVTTWAGLTVMVIIISGGDAECPLGWQHYEQKWYWFSTIAHSWHAAAVCLAIFILPSNNLMGFVLLEL